jgi:hypothetical protein
MPCLERWGIFNDKIMTRIDILNQQLGLLNTEKLTAVGARLRQVNRRITVITDALYRLYNYPITTVSSSQVVNVTFEGVPFKVLCGNDEWRLIGDATKFMIQAKIGDTWSSIQIFEKLTDLMP